MLEVFPAQGFRTIGAGSFEIDPAEPADYSLLLDDLKRKGIGPDLVVHLWGLGQDVLVNGRQDAEDLALKLAILSPCVSRTGVWCIGYQHSRGH